MIKPNKLPEWVNWIARDEDGALWAYQVEPHKNLRSMSWLALGGFIAVEEDDILESIKWTDDRPTTVTHNRIKLGE